MINQRGMKNLLRYLLPAFVVMVTLCSQAYAQSDARMVIDVPRNEHGDLPSVQEAIRSALPVLWDRVLPQAARGSVTDGINATSFLQRVVPYSDGIQVIFNHDRVWSYLEQQQIPYLKEAVHLNLDIEMINRSGISMSKTAEALMQYAGEVAVAHGIVMDRQMPRISATWRWLDGSQISLNVRGGALQEMVSEVRPVSGDPLIQLQLWTSQLLVSLRDNAASGGDLTAGELPAAEAAINTTGSLLTIEQTAPLPEQVVLEEALRQNRSVQSLIPVYLSSTSRQYRIQLKDNDDSWIQNWFGRRGMQAEPTPEGWLVR